MEFSIATSLLMGHFASSDGAAMDSLGTAEE
jgi:hypothetical protein